MLTKRKTFQTLVVPCRYLKILYKSSGSNKGKNNKGEEIRTLRITTDSTRAAVKTCHSRTPTKKVKCDGIFFYSFYIRGLILSLSKGEGYRTHTLVKEI
jgi:hypothetical protein